MVEVLKRFLAPLASQIDGVYDLESALELAAHGHYNVVILDLRMEQTGKAEALHAIREFKNFNSAVVVVSGIVDPHLKDEALAAGADAFVPKDDNFGKRAMLLATNIATLKLPHDSYQSDSYLTHVDLLHKMVTEL